jgi:hypothetical protein
MIGFLYPDSPEPRALVAFREGLSETGFVDHWSCIESPQTRRSAFNSQAIGWFPFELAIPGRVGVFQGLQRCWLGRIC